MDQVKWSSYPVDAKKPSEEHPANNLSLRALKVIDDTKTKIEAKCPKIVSCADILAFTACDSALKVVRQDRRASLQDHLPPPSFNAKELEDSFARNSLSLVEMVTLSSHILLMGERREALKELRDQLQRSGSGASAAERQIFGKALVSNRGVHVHVDLGGVLKAKK
ncbi:peroxidase 5-like [Prunus avium]|uniref:peroxidase n=1 Tax=Prunus avium TaxID=42229 RepID=A0A6P5TRY4_PRUAV|nr:peroxidase 5-like [Prunus avium]